MSKKERERAEKAEKDRVESARKSRVKAADSDRKFQDVLSGDARSKGRCEPFNYHVRTDSGE
jgi:hypothetical protein